MARALASLILLLLPAAPARPAPGFQERTAEFRQRLAAAGVDRRAGAPEVLDPTDPRSIGLLYEMLLDGHWYVRGAGVHALGGVDDEALRAKMRLDLATDERAMVREGIADALGIQPIEGDAKALVGALGDEHWTVRRAAARSLGEIVSREGIEALVERLDPDEHPRVRIWAAWSLRTVTAQTGLGQDRARWRAWWSGHRDHPGLRPLRGDAEVKRRKLAGIELETVTVAREGPPRADLLVMGRYGYRDDYLRPYLDDLSARFRVTYVRLPGLRELTGVAGYDGQGGIPRYPVAKLVRAFEALRRELGRERVAILAHGATGWIAIRYARTHPRRTLGLILVDSWLDALGYTAALLRMREIGDVGERFVAETLTNENRVPKTPAAYAAIARIMLTSSFEDRADLDAAHVWWSSYEPQGFSVVPDVRFGARDRLEVPTLFYFSLDHPLSGHISQVRIRRHVPEAIIAIMRRSRGHPYIDEPDEFYRVLDGFLARYPVNRPR